MKTKKINGLTRVIAEKGMRITKGDGEYLFAVDLAVSASEEGYYEITEEEYQKIFEEQQKENDSI